MNLTIRPTQALVVVALTNEKGGMLESCKVELADLETSLNNLIQTHKLAIHPTAIQWTLRHIEHASQRSDGMGQTFDICDASWRPVMLVVLT